MEFQMKENGFYTQVEYGELHISSDSAFGYRPYQLLVSSVAVCSGGILRTILEKQRMKINDIHIQADVTRSEEGAKEVQKIDLLFQIKGEELNLSKIEKALSLTRKNCSMIQSVKNSIEVTESFEII